MQNITDKTLLNSIVDYSSITDVYTELCKLSKHKAKNDIDRFNQIVNEGKAKEHSLISAETKKEFFSLFFSTQTGYSGSELTEKLSGYVSNFPQSELTENKKVLVSNEIKDLLRLNSVYDVLCGLYIIVKTKMKRSDSMKNKSIINAQRYEEWNTLFKLLHGIFLELELSIPVE